MSLSLLRRRCFDLSKHFIGRDHLKITIHPIRSFSNGSSINLCQAKTQFTADRELKIKANEAWKNMDKKEKMKILVKDYGKTIIIFHIIISLISLGIFYALVSSGLDMSAIVNLFSSESNKKVNDAMLSSSTFLVAYGVHKLFAPVRLSITIAFAPIMVRYFRRIGLIKPAIIKAVENKK